MKHVHTQSWQWDSIHDNVSEFLKTVFKEYSYCVQKILFKLWRIFARVSATLQVFTPERFLMPPLVDWELLERLTMYWVFLE